MVMMKLSHLLKSDLLYLQETVDIDTTVVRNVSKLYPVLRQAIGRYENELRCHVLVCGLQSLTLFNGC